VSVTLLAGDNILEIDEAVRAARSKFDVADTVILSGTDMAMSALTEACLTAGLFATERLVVVNELHARYKGSRKENASTDGLRDILSSVLPTTTVLLVERDMSSDHALAGDVRAAGGAVRIHMTPKKNDLPGWIVSRCKRQDTRIERHAAELLAEMIGPNPLRLQSEIDKLAAFTDGGEITHQAVDKLVGAVSQDTIFALVDAIAAGDQGKALGLLRSQLDAASSGPIDFALYLIRMLARQMRILFRIRLAKEAGRENDQIIADLKLPRYYADRYFRQSERLPKDRLRGSFERLAQLEHGLKSGRAEATSALDLLVADMCA